MAWRRWLGCAPCQRQTTGDGKQRNLEFVPVHVSSSQTGQVSPQPQCQQQPCMAVLRLLRPVVHDPRAAEHPFFRLQPKPRGSTVVKLWPRGKIGHGPASRGSHCQVPVDGDGGVVLLRQLARKVEGGYGNGLRGQRAQRGEGKGASPQWQGHGARGAAHELELLCGATVSCV